MPLNVSRVRWNWLSTASLEGKRFYESQIGILWIINGDFLLADTFALDSDVIEVWKSEFSVEMGAGIAFQILQKRPEALCSWPYKKIKLDYQTEKSIVALSMSIESSWS